MAGTLQLVEQAERDEYLDNVLIGGRERREIAIVDYDPAWPQRFEHERARIQAALGRVACGIHHIGSTSVPGLSAKPIIDVLVTIDDPEDELAFGPALAGAGYQLRVREAGHRMFRSAAKDVHVHVLAHDGVDVDRHLIFRDHLRRSPEDRERYALLKRSLAERQWSDMNHYADAKGPLIEEMLARAHQISPTESGHVRPARVDDAPATASLLGELGYPTSEHDARQRLARVLDREGEGMLVYELEQEAVGLLTWQLTHLIYRARPQLRITALVVREAFRRRGIANALLGAAQSLARERGCIRLELTTRAERADAVALYLAAGFRERPRRMVKDLDER